MVPRINRQLIHKLQKQAKNIKRKRVTYNFHTTFSDPINRMLNAIEPGSYVQPHKHENPDKREVFLVITGKAVVVFFDNSGAITEHIVLSHNDGDYGLEVPPGIWHMLFSLEEGTVVYEVKDGPYDPAEDKNFAPWAPKEGEEACTTYLNDICQELGL